MSLAEAPFDLVDAKLAPPFRRPGMVAKANAIARLHASRSPLVTVIAPAGYGKTTLRYVPAGSQFAITSELRRRAD